MRRQRVSARVRANRRNAQRSTGPKTIAGKARVARNPLIHGLEAAEPVSAAGGIESLAARFIADVGEFTGDANTLRQAARELAEAQVHVLEVRRIRRGYWLRLLERGEASVGQLPPPVGFTPIYGLAKLQRLAASMARRTDKRQEPLRNIDALERYERRALARRKRAARAFADVVASGLQAPSQCA